MLYWKRGLKCCTEIEGWNGVLELDTSAERDDELRLQGFDPQVSCCSLIPEVGPVEMLCMFSHMLIPQCSLAATFLLPPPHPNRLYFLYVNIWHQVTNGLKDIVISTNVFHSLWKKRAWHLLWFIRIHSALWFSAWFISYHRFKVSALFWVICSKDQMKERRILFIFAQHTNANKVLPSSLYGSVMVSPICYTKAVLSRCW